MKYAYIATILLLSATSFRAGSITYFDLAMVTFLVSSGIFSRRKFFSALYDARIILAMATMYIAAMALSTTQTMDPSSHFIRSITPIGVICIMWIFVYQIGPIFRGEIEEFSLVLCIAMTAGSISVIYDGITYDGIRDMHDVSRQVGWMEHPIEAGYVASIGVIIGAWRRTFLRSHWSLVLVAINLYSIRYSASMTAVAGTIGGLILLSIAAKKFGMAVGVAVGVILCFWLIPTLSESFFYTRILEALGAGAGYTTVASRLEQIELVWNLIDLPTLFFGNGFSDSEINKVGGLEIHNSILGALFHFGLIGAAAQATGIGIMLTPLLIKSIPLRNRVLLASMLLAFAAAYFTGPSMRRRTIWIPPAAMSALLLYSRHRKVRRFVLDGDCKIYAQPGLISASSNMPSKVSSNI